MGTTGGAEHTVTLSSGAGGSAVAPTPLGDRVHERVLERHSQIVLGLDPDPARLWPRAVELASGASPGERTGRAFAAHCRLALDAAGEECVAVKPQLACFERLGAWGWTALAEVVADARERGLLVIADAKRNDFDRSLRAYGQAFFGGVPDGPFGPVPGLGVDLLTVNPLLGADSLQALMEEARAAGGGAFVLVRTSNPGAQDLQDLRLADGGTVSDAIAALVDELGADHVGASGLSDLGAVIGATVPEHLTRLREAMPHAIILMPGIGPQGGSGEGLEAAFAPGPAGGLLAASRGIVDAHRAPGGAGADPAEAARAEAARLRELMWTVYER
jgi:orotidine-5'-phosphate decarboxylase